jgi:adenylylsulfate kinase
VTPTIIWFTGLPASGKSTLAERTREALAATARAAVVLDGDTVRDCIGARGYAADDRDAFYRALAALAAMIARQGVIAIVAATAPRREHRDAARIPGIRLVEVWVRATLAECEARDVKQLYGRARRGEVDALPGIGVAFEPPEHADVIASGGRDDPALAAITRLVAC